MIIHSVCGAKTGSFILTKGLVAYDGDFTSEDRFHVWFSGSKAFLKRMEKTNGWDSNQIVDFDRKWSVLFNDSGTDKKSLPIPEVDPAAYDKLKLVNISPREEDESEEDGFRYNFTHEGIDISLYTMRIQRELEILWDIAGIPLEGIRDYLKSTREIPVKVIVSNNPGGSISSLTIIGFKFEDVDEEIFEIPEESEVDRKARFELIEKLQLMWKEKSRSDN